MKKTITFLLFLVAAIFLSNIFAQSQAGLSSVMQSYSLDNPPPGGVITYIQAGDSIVDTFIHDPNEEVRVIVQFSSPPLANYLSGRGTVRHTGYETASTNIVREQYSFRSALGAIEGRHNSEEHPYRLPAETEIRHEYQLVLNGMALTTRQWVVDEIKELPYVLSVHTDEKVYALLDASVAHIGAEAIWTDYGITGEGIVVGILDTGIDYMHPDLGGGIGEGYKVLGGWDFVSGNADPMDDHRHGTHVAGIVAADGVLKGVAPAAKLMAYKVLGADGSGLWSWTIGGIEQAVADGVHILNASLGGPGNPDDPTSTAIDNASAAGVLCVVAAGNIGPGYYSIISPGCARSALTVGATALNDNIAGFSSRGPEPTFHLTKPDVLAPGVSTLAPVLNGQYARLSGTSMATPHVAGAAALFLQQHPGFNTSQLKSIFSHTAIDLGYDVWTQGTGRIDLVNAFELPEIIVEPPKLSMGSVDLTEDTWTSTKSVTVTNYESYSKSVNINIAGDFPEGALLTVTPESFTLPPQSSQELTITLEVNNALVPFPDNDPSSFTDSFQLLVDEKEINVPIVFVKNRILKLQFDEPPTNVVIGGENISPNTLSFFDPGLEIVAFIPEGLYDIVVVYDDGETIVFREDVEVDSFVLLQVSKAEATNHVVAHNVDENGRIMIPPWLCEQFYTAHFNLIRLRFIPGYINRQISDFSNFNWSWATSHHSSDNEHIYVYGDALSECNSDVVQSFEPDALKRFSFSYPNLEPGHQLFPILSLQVAGFKAYVYDSWAEPREHPFAQTVFVSPNFRYSSNQFSFYIDTYDFSGHPFFALPEDLLFKSASFSIDDNNKHYAFNHYYSFYPLSFHKSILPSDFDVFRVGLSPPVSYGSLYILSDRIILYNLLFLSQMKDHESKDEMPYRLFKDATLTSGGNLFDDLAIIPVGSPNVGMAGELPLQPGSYVLELDYESYAIHGQEGNATARLGFDNSGLTGHTPIPMLKSLNIESNGQITDFVGLCQEATIQFSINMPDDYAAPEEVSLEVRTENKNTWAALQLEHDDTLFWAEVPDTLPEGFVSIRIRVEDPAESFVEYIAQPAFLRAPITLPEVYTLASDDIFGTSASFDGFVAFDGGASITERGMVWSKSGNPSLEHNNGFTNDGQGIGRYTSNLNGLEAETTYYVRAYATNAHDTAYGEEIMFVTLDLIECYPEQLPFNQEFDQASPPGLPVCWYSNGVNSFQVDVAQWFYHHGQLTSARLNYQAFSQAILITPRVVVNGQTVRMRFSAWPGDLKPPAFLVVGTISDPDDYNTFVPYREFSLEHQQQDPWILLEAYFEDIESTETHFAIKVGDYTTNEEGLLYVKDLLVEHPPSCPEPYHLQVTDIDTNSALLQWSQYGDFTTWDMLLGTEGFDPNTEGTLVEHISQPYYFAYDLDFNMSYEFYARVHCEQATSGWSIPQRFTTSCEELSIPFFENFDTWTYPNLDVCWSSLGSLVNGNFNVDISNCKYHSPHQSARLFCIGDSYATLLTPQIPGDLTVSTLSFMTLLGDCPEIAYLQIGLMSDPEDINTFSLIEVFEVTNKIGDPWHSFETSFDYGEEADRYLAFRIECSTWDYWTRLFIDDVSISLPEYQIDVTVSPFGAGTVEGAGVYQHGEQVTLSASPAENHVFVNWTEDVFVVSGHASYTFTAGANRQLIANFAAETTGVPDLRVLEDHTLADGEVACFDALVSIYLSGPGGPFVVELGGHVSLIAGEYIMMLPGTHAKEGSYLHAYIAPDGPFCSEKEPDVPVVVKAGEPPDELDAISPTQLAGNEQEMTFRIYPNPTQDQFTLEMLHYNIRQDITIEIFNMHGTLVKNRKFTATRQQTFSLEGRQPGIYLIRVLQVDQTGVERLIKE